MCLIHPRLSDLVHDQIAVTLLRNASMRISSLGTSRNAFNRGREIPESRGPLDMPTWCANGVSHIPTRLAQT